MPADVLRDLERLRYEYLLAQGKARREAVAAGGGDPNQPAGLGLTLTYAPEAPAGPPGEDTIARLMQDYLMDRQATRLGPLEAPGAPALGPTLPGYGPPPAGPPRPAQAPTMPPEQPGLPDISREMPDPTAGRATQTLGDALAGPKPPEVPVPQAYVSPAEAQLHQGIVAGGMPLPMTRQHAQAMADVGYPVETVEPTLGERLGAAGRAAGFGTFGRGGVGPPPSLGEWVTTQAGRIKKGKDLLTRDVGEIVGSLAEKLSQTVAGRNILATKRIPPAEESMIIAPEAFITPGQQGPRIILGDLYEPMLRAAHGGSRQPKPETLKKMEDTMRGMRGPDEITPYPVQPALAKQIARELKGSGLEWREAERLRDPAFRAQLADQLGVDPAKIPDLVSSIRQEYTLGKPVEDWYVGAYPMLQKIVKLIQAAAPTARARANIDVENDPLLLSKLIAVLSPQRRPDRNVRDAFLAYQRYLERGRPAPRGANPTDAAIETFREQLGATKGLGLMPVHAVGFERAVMGRPFESQKVSNFLLDILGSEWNATIDRWAANALLREHPTTARLTDAEYQMANYAMAEIAKAFGTTPVRLQAALWSGSKALRDPVMRELLLEKGLKIDQVIAPLRSVIEREGTKFATEINLKKMLAAPAMLAGLTLLDQAQRLEQEQRGGAPPEQ